LKNNNFYLERQGLIEDVEGNSKIPLSLKTYPNSLNVSIRPFRILKIPSNKESIRQVLVS